MKTRIIRLTAILATLANGEQRRFAWDGGGRWHRVTLEHASRAVSARRRSRSSAAT